VWNKCPKSEHIVDEYDSLESFRILVKYRRNV
jgi:hypothetical protein